MSLWSRNPITSISWNILSSCAANAVSLLLYDMKILRIFILHYSFSKLVQIFIKAVYIKYIYILKYAFAATHFLQF